MTTRNPKTAFRIVALAIVVILSVLGRDSLTEAPTEVPIGGPGNGSAMGAQDGSREIRELFDARRSDVVVEVAGVVDRTLADDTEGSPHQRFILRLNSGHTLLVAHNIELAARVPLGAGDVVSLRGEYEWNEQGGVLHWTHHDPQGRREGGWIQHDGTRYR